MARRTVGDSFFTKEEVSYRYAARPEEQSCGICQHFTAPNACELVAGLIRPVDTCDKFERDPTATVPKRGYDAIDSTPRRGPAVEAELIDSPQEEDTMITNRQRADITRLIDQLEDTAHAMPERRDIVAVRERLLETCSVLRQRYGIDRQPARRSGVAEAYRRNVAGPTTPSPSGDSIVVSTFREGNRDTDTRPAPRDGLLGAFTRAPRNG